MKIIKQTPFNSGNYPSIQFWSQSSAPEGYYIWSDGLDETNFYKYNGFVILNIVKNSVVGYEPNKNAWEQWIKENPDDQDKEDEVSDTEILNILLGIN